MRLGGQCVLFMRVCGGAVRGRGAGGSGEMEPGYFALACLVKQFGGLERNAGS